MNALKEWLVSLYTSEHSQWDRQQKLYGVVRRIAEPDPGLVEALENEFLRWGNPSVSEEAIRRVIDALAAELVKGQKP